MLVNKNMKKFIIKYIREYSPKTLHISMYKYNFYKITKINEVSLKDIGHIKYKKET